MLARTVRGPGAPPRPGLAAAWWGRTRPSARTVWPDVVRDPPARPAV